ncbi:hypothetical protein OPT61_g5728 [Boeremia exigua]|uniref:Uncharacterized protein n=1 Tax=Boeremia exigua TaxID=749465 RepID=A0ACC2I9A2_9PLEO|nr:hypothetical protein OPT61_g5728 [Boeremia exigua]
MNDTYVYGEDGECSNKKFQVCAKYRGGVYNRCGFARYHTDLVRGYKYLRDNVIFEKTGSGYTSNVEYQGGNLVQVYYRKLTTISAGNVLSFLKLGGIMQIRKHQYSQKFSSSAIAYPPMTHAPDDVFANWTTDIVNLSDQSSLEEFEFGVRGGNGQDFIFQGELGLGVDSNLFTSLKEARKISSRSYSFFWGSTVPDRSRDGSLTVGGYDNSLLDNSSSTTTKFSRGERRCIEGMLVELTNLALLSSDGTRSDILAGGDRLRACVTPFARHVLRLPKRFGDILMSKLGVKQLNTSDETMYDSYYRSTYIEPRSTTFKGILSVVLNDECKITVPHEQILIEEPYIDEKGLLQRNSARTSVSIEIMPENANVLPQIGGLFFSSAYLMVNHDENQFSISRLQQNSLVLSLIGIDSANKCHGQANEATLPASLDNDNNQDQPLTTGKIAAIIIGVVVAFLLLIVAAFWSRRRRRNSASHGSVAMVTGPQPIHLAEKHGKNICEMHEGGNIPEADSTTMQFAAELECHQHPVSITARQQQTHCVNGAATLIQT